MGNNNVIIVLGCHTNDLAILNDIKTIERLHKENPEASVYLGGCSAYRVDIELPSYVKRLEVTRSKGAEIKEGVFRLIHSQKPFWSRTASWNKTDDEFAEGYIFRNMYPLKIGAGCYGECKHCIIKCSRGNCYTTDAFRQVNEFLDHDDVVLVSDRPTWRQIKDWAFLANRYDKPISLENVEPTVAVRYKDELLDLAEQHLLKIFHCPIRSNDPDLLKIMGYDVKATMGCIELMEQLRKCGTKVATEIITDYVVLEDGVTRTYKNMDVEWLNHHFDYWVWIPYFDGKWDRKKAEQRFEHYINDTNEDSMQAANTEPTNFFD